MNQPHDAVVSLAPALIVDDDPAMRLRLRHLLERVAPDGPAPTQAASLCQARDILERFQPCFALVDIGLPDGSGVDLIEHLRQTQPQVQCVVVSAWGLESVVLSALRAGAIGYLLKEREDDELAMALRGIQRGGSSIDPSVALHVLRLLAPPPSQQEEASPLSEREHEILVLVSRGYSNREIAELTTLSRFTIEDYTKSIYRKLAVRSRTAAVFEAQAKGLLR